VSTVLLAAIAVAPARADVIYSNLGPGGTFDTNGWLVGGQMQVIAHQFTPAADYTFTDAQLALGVITGTINTMNVYLMTDFGGFPDEILELMIATDIGPFPPSALVTVTSKELPTLGADTPYWIVATSPGGNLAWNWNSIGLVCTDTDFVFNQMDSPTGPWTQVSRGNALSAYQLNGDPVAKGAGVKQSKPSAKVPLKASDLQKR
jgi:hypothetical protein